MQPSGSLSRRTLMRLSLGVIAAGAMPLAKAGPAPQRVITLFQGATDTAVALGIRPAGVVDSWSEKPMYRYLRPALAGVPHVGLETQPSLEDIALLTPDLIVASRFRHERVKGLLEQLCPVVMLDEVFEFRHTLRVMGAATARDVEAQALQARWDARISALRTRLASKFGARWPLSVSVLDVREDHVRSYLHDSFAGSVLAELGFVWNRQSRDATGVSIKLRSRESLPVADADVFFVFGRADSPAVQRYYQAITHHPLWQRMSAPKAGQVWWVDGVAWIFSGGILSANRVLDDIERTLLQDAAA
ncbi:ABC transporter substrate-binding protein [Pseudomonas sp. CNPSo 3701]|uniref:ABC transporter substrate-binding protein n=1 Tax=Pseudomonas sp. CNPSo 3701 TaxID=3027943 RepID=UPI0023649D39|nr:iron-siderophore ABC transporter substrate-binding protein [Pseudomonas sp. CNPSo 3701]MDD1507498.1 iron-siderophore ABC transporter substrate-binding protein [Pseudomonas sp. CNPSo 3701]